MTIESLTITRREGDCITKAHLVRLGEEGWHLVQGRHEDDQYVFVFEKGSKWTS